MQERKPAQLSEEQKRRKATTAIHAAVCQNNLEMVGILATSVTLASKNYDDQTPFELACELGFYECAEQCIPNPQKYINEDGGQYGKLFLYAVDHAYTFKGLAEKLFLAGASMTAKTRKDGHSALHLAVTAFDKETVAFLIKSGASLTVEACTHSPISLACHRKSWECAKLLIESLDINSFSKEELPKLKLNLALGSAIEYGRVDIIKFLLLHGADCNKYNEHFGNDTLASAILSREYSTEIIQILLEHGADPNMRNRDGETSYDIALRNKKFAAARLLALYDTGPQPEKTNTLAVSINDHFEKIFNPALNPREILSKLYAYELLTAVLFEIDLKSANAQRNLLLLHRDKHTEEIANLDKLIDALHQLRNFPDQIIKLDDRIKNTVAGHHIEDHLKRLQQIQQYHARVKEYLLALRARINGTHFMVKSFLETFTNKWHEGTPKHIQLIVAELNKLKEQQELPETLLIYHNVYELLSDIPSRKVRHENTSAFYLQEKSAMETLHFLAPQDSIINRI